MPISSDVPFNVLTIKPKRSLGPSRRTKLETSNNTVPTFNWGSGYDLAGGQTAYVKGVWASTLVSREETMAACRAAMCQFAAGSHARSERLTKDQKHEVQEGRIQTLDDRWRDCSIHPETREPVD